MPQTKEKTATAARAGLSDVDEEKVEAAVARVVAPSNEWHAASLRYGRKVAKRARGLRTSNPPLAGISKERADAVKKAVEEALG